MNPLKLIKNSKYKKVLGYLFLIYISLFISFYLTFPISEVGQKLSNLIYQNTSGKIKVIFDDISLYRLNGIEGSNVKIQMIKENKEIIHFTVDKLYAYLKISSLLKSQIEVSIQFILGEGSLNLSIFPKNENNISLKAILNNINLQKPLILPKILDTSFSGILNGEIEYKWYKDEIKQQLKMDIDTHHIQLGPITIKEFSIPKINLGDLNAQIKMDKNKIQLFLKQISVGDIEIKKADGHILLQKNKNNSEIDFCTIIKPKEDFLEKNNKIKNALDLGLNIKQILRDKKGFIHFPIKGKIRHIRPIPKLCSI